MKQRRILVVDDEPGIRQSLSGVLEDEGYQVEAVESGEACLAALPGADLAASMVGGVQSFSKQAVGDLNTFTSRITNVTNPPPPPSRTSYRGGGGGGCACACACAGCACACAGGGR